jgi:gluconolactonase
MSEALRTVSSGSTTFTVKRWADGLQFPEGPVWAPGQGLLFSDVHGARIYRALPEGGVEPWLDKNLKTNGLTLTPDGKGLYACDHGLRRLLHIDLQNRHVTELTSGSELGGLVNVNDVAVGPTGRVYFTDPDFPGAGRGTSVSEARHGVYGWDPGSSGTLRRMAPTPQATIAALPNGLGFSQDGQVLYVAFSGEHTVRRYQVLPDGALQGGDIAIHLESGANPDGLALDQRGWLWQTQYGNGRVDAYDLATGRRIHALQLATGAVTNITFQADTEDRVFWVTAASTPEDPGGKIWRVEMELAPQP